MAGTVDDFIKRFGDKGTLDDDEASHYLDRFASNDPQHKDFDNDALSSSASEYLGKLPDDQFQQAAQNAYANASPAQQQGLMASLLRAVQNRGGNLGGILGQSGGAPSQIDARQYAQAAGYARQHHPDAMQDVVREQPALLKAMGNPILMGALGMVASRMIKSRMQPQQTMRQPAAQSGVGGLLGKLF